MRKIKLFREFIENHDNVIDGKMQELKDLIDGMSDQSIVYEWENKSDHEVVVNFTYSELSIRYEFDVDQMYVAKFVGDTTDFQTYVESIDEGLEVIEKDIQSILGISENKIPKKYLTHKPKAMKKEIETFRGKKEYKKDWEADIDKRSNKRIKTKKSAATKAYQRMFGGKNENSSEWFSLTDKYNELPDDVLFPRTENDIWLKETPTHIKLLSMICGMIDGNITERFELDDAFFSALENEYRYIGFELTKDEVIESCYRLREEGYLK